MPFVGVPWAVDEALMHVESMRLGAYVAGGEGVGKAGDLAVLPTSPASAQVRIMPGVAAVLNRGEGPDGGGQSYLVRNARPEDDSAGDSDVFVAVSAVGGATRRDLVALIVEDPHYDGQPAPADTQNGPYNRVVVYEGVPAGTTRLADVAPDQAGLELALITRPAGTATIAAEHLTDLRALACPRTSERTFQYNVPVGADAEQLAGGFNVFPSDAEWDVEVPAWATRAHLRVDVIGLRVTRTSTSAANLGGLAVAQLGTQHTDYAYITPPYPANGAEFPYQTVAAGEVAVAAADRGTTLTLSSVMERATPASSVHLEAQQGTVVVASVRFEEGPDVGVWSA